MEKDYKHLLCTEPKNVYIHEDMSDRRPQFIYVKLHEQPSGQVWSKGNLYGQHVALLETGELVYYRDSGSTDHYFGYGDCTIGKGVYHHSERIE